MKRIVLFLATNIAILVVLTIVVRLFGLDRYLGAGGEDNLAGLLAFAAVFGFGGAFISLAMSKWIAKRSMGVHVITQPSSPTEQWLVSTVRAQAELAGIGMPEVGIFNSPEPNAFATGARRNAALVAVSTGLLQKMRREEVEAVLGHEVAHVANGDMVTLTLIQGVVNTFVIFLSRIIGRAVDKAVFRSENGNGPGYFISVIVAQLVLGFLASMIVMWFSRHREFRADRGGAKLAGSQNMIGALEALRRNQQQAEGLPEAMRAFGINGGKGGGIKRLFMSHPPLEERIAALQEAR
ncbi:MAG TPA: protease HtpX [Steroidobacteraceae bacterium]|nr:protease HtpX [Steroidobacteraceae bacterium]